jgi:hypothetical protein
LQNVANTNFCSLIDINDAFLSVALTERAKKRSAIVTPFGVFLPQRTQFGLKTSKAQFCYVMRIVFKELEFCSVYMEVSAFVPANVDQVHVPCPVYERSY